jgi:hypothetical protein
VYAEQIPFQLKLQLRHLFIERSTEHAQSASDSTEHEQLFSSVIRYLFAKIQGISLWLERYEYLFSPLVKTTETVRGREQLI